MKAPDYAGGSLVNLVAELEGRLGGGPPSAPLHERLAAAIPEADTYVLVLFDGLGDGQLAHPAAAALAQHRRAAIDTVFPTTTTVALASVATGLPPSAHGLLGYQLDLPEVGEVVNTIKWTTLWGAPVPYDYPRFLPAPNLWERLGAIGVEPVTVQPGHFAASPLSQVLYRGCRWEPAYTVDELVTATRAVAATPRRLVFTYVPHVDFAAHVYGQEAPEYEEALWVAAGVWEQLVAGLPPGVVVVGVADHGHADFPAPRQVRIAKADHEGRVFYGDSRAMFVRGDGEALARTLPATWVERADMEGWWGPAPHHAAFGVRVPDGVLVADDGWVLLHRYSDDRLIGHHGALTAREARVPLLVAGRPAG